MKMNLSEVPSRVVIVVLNMDTSMVGKKIGPYTVEKRTADDSIYGENIQDRLIRHADTYALMEILQAFQDDRFMTFECNQKGTDFNTMGLKMLSDALLLFKPSDFHLSYSMCFNESGAGGSTSIIFPVLNRRKKMHNLSLSDDELFQLKTFREKIQRRCKLEEVHKEIKPRVSQMIDLYNNAMYAFPDFLQFLQYIMIFEQAAMVDKEMTYRISRNIALLLGNDVEECIFIEKEIKGLYGIRSAITHGRNSRVEYEDVVKARDYACRLIRKLIEIGIVGDMGREYTNSGYGSFNPKTKDEEQMYNAIEVKSNPWI